MKKISLALFVLLTSVLSFGQAPQKFNYQAVVRDAGGISVTDQLVGVRVSILQGSVLGSSVFSETHGPTTNAYGLINLQIGTGANTGPALSTIDWSSNQYYIKVEIDPSGGTNYTLASTSQLVSVPYALHAKTVDNADDADADPTNEYNTGAVVNGTNLEITDGGGTITVDMSSIAQDADSNPTNELQTLSKVGQIVSLSNGGGAFTDDVNDADASVTNELNTGFTLVGTTLQITDAGGTLSANLSSIANDADSNPTNELQTISKVGNTVTLSNGGGSFTDAVDDADADNTNELQIISKAGSTVTLSNGGGSFTDDVDDADADPANELQTVNKVGNTVTLSNGGGSFTTDDSDSNPANEFNTSASLTGSTLNITDGGGTLTVDLSSLGGGADPSSSNELITNAQLVGTNLTITEAGTPWTVDLSSLGGAGNPTDELNTTFVLNGNVLEITDAGGTLTADLSPIITGGGDLSPTNELNTTMVLNGTTLELTDAGGTLTTDLSSLGGGGSSYRVGQLLGGGIIVYVDSSGQHGLIAGLTDLGGANPLFENPNTTALLVGASSFIDGEGNTALLVADAANYEAAILCDSYAVGGTGWFLPSVYELQIMCRSGFVMGVNALTYNTTYWSSTELTSGTMGLSAYTVNSNYGFIETKTQGTTGIKVRPMKKF
ncbi:MAG: hypothetical protein R2780_13800 [Crocinitomicaceae bacterium]